MMRNLLAGGFNHPFFIPGTLGVALAVCFGFVLGSFML